MRLGFLLSAVSKEVPAMNNFSTGIPSSPIEKNVSLYGNCFWNTGMQRILLQKLSNKAWLSAIIVSGCWPFLITIFSLHGTSSLFFWWLEQRLGQECSYGEIAQICGFTQYIFKTRCKFNPPPLPAMSKTTATYKPAVDCILDMDFPDLQSPYIKINICKCERSAEARFFHVFAAAEFTNH